MRCWVPGCIVAVVAASSLACGSSWGATNGSGASYSTADLAGTWEANTLASGPGAPWWERGQTTIASDGSFTGSTIDSDGATGTVAGTLAISSDGVVTLVGASTFRGVLDAGKTILVGTDTWSSGSPGTTEMKIFTRVH